MKLPTFIQQIDKLRQAADILLSPGSNFGIAQLLVAFIIGIGFLALRQKRRRGVIRPRAIWRSLAGSRRILRSPSMRADIFYYAVNTFAASGLIGWGFFSTAKISQFVVHAATAAFGTLPPAQAPAWTLRAGITLAVFIGYEIGYYVDHALKHKIPLLWAFHKTHHTAEVLTPLTIFRVHPVDTLIFVDILAVTIGTLHGLFTYAVGRQMGMYTVAGNNALSVICFFLLAQLQHSQFWIPLRGLPGRIVLSPAHHQIHHSSDPAHYNCNFGSSLAIWDWLFGTLNVPPAKSPPLAFGVTHAGANPHRILGLMVAPFSHALSALRRPGTAAPASFPLNRPRRLAGNVVGDTVDAPHLVDDTV